MTVLMRLTDAEIEELADAALRREMQELSFQGVTVSSGVDYDGAPALFVTARLGASVPALDGAVFARIHGVLHDTLLSRGEERFPYFRLSRSDDEVPDDDGFERGE